MNSKFTKQLFRCCIIFILTMLIIQTVGWLDQRCEETFEAVHVVSERVLIPGGQSVGIQMDTKGVLVVGLEEIETEQGIISPGYLAGLQIGDMILSVDGKPVYNAEDVGNIINSKKNKIDMTVLRKKEELQFQVQPVKSLNDETYKIGVWVKERIAGIGTLTFYDPKTNMFAALGHGIYESRTGTLLGVESGELLSTEVKSITEGAAGKPGEIRGIFYSDTDALGLVIENSSFGIYSEGKDFSILQNTEPMIMAVQDQIKEGPAVIRTTISGNTVETFNIYIDKVNRQKAAGSKGLELTVTDERLLANCGGIVQGMSGSPIIQNGRIVGAVTHVFVDNPTKGYGIFAQWMVEECEKYRILK